MFDLRQYTLQGNLYSWKNVEIPSSISIRIFPIDTVVRENGKKGKIHAFRRTCYSQTSFRFVPHVTIRTSNISNFNYRTCRTIRLQNSFICNTLYDIHIAG